MSFYNWFLIVFFLWVLGRAWRYRQQAKNQRSIAKSLESIEKKLDDLTKREGHE